MAMMFYESELGHIKTAYIPCSLCKRCKHYTRILDKSSSFIAECRNGSNKTAAYISQKDNYQEQGFCSCFEQKGMGELSSEFGGKKRTKWAMPFALLALVAGSYLAFRENPEIMDSGAILVIILGVCIVIAILYRKLIKQKNNTEKSDMD